MTDKKRSKFLIIIISHETEKPFENFVCRRLVRCEWVTSHLWMSHGAHVDGSCRIVTGVKESWYTYERVPPSRMDELWNYFVCRHRLCCVKYIWVSRVKRINESCPTYQRVLSHTWLKTNTVRTLFCLLINESWHIHGWVISHIWRSHGTHVKESHPSYEWVVKLCVSPLDMSCHTYKWAMSHV